MARKQTRRVVRITAELFTRLYTYCKQNGVSKSAVVEKVLKPLLVRTTTITTRQ